MLIRNKIDETVIMNSTEIIMVFFLHKLKYVLKNNLDIRRYYFNVLNIIF